MRVEPGLQQPPVHEAVAFEVNGRPVVAASPMMTPLAEVLRDELGLTGTKLGCSAGDCGACTVLLDGEQVCACLVALGQAAGRRVVTVEGLAADGRLSLLQEAFHLLGAAQCGICTPGMLLAATELLARNPAPEAGEVEEALGGVLCRCTGYRKIVEAVLAAAAGKLPPLAEGAMGARLPRLDGHAKLTGEERFGADQWPEGCLSLRLVRSPHHRARFALGDLDTVRERHPGLVRILTAADVPGRNGFGIYPHLKDQPVLADAEVRHRGEPVLALVGEPDVLARIRDEELPIRWQPLPGLHDVEAALVEGAPTLHGFAPGNVLTQGRVIRGDVEAEIGASAVTLSCTVETSFVEHAYIEPEAGFALRSRDRVEVHGTTQSPYMDRDEVAGVLGIAPEQVRIVPTACGGGFGGKLDSLFQPILAVAAWVTGRPVRTVWTRPESMVASTKRHPARITATAGASADGRLTGFRFHGDFDTGAYASWGPTVASRVPVHATGPYRVAAARCTTRAVYTNNTPAGAFRGFGVPQSAIAHEALMDGLADRLGIDRLEMRLLNALRPGDVTHFGQKLEGSVGLVPCLEALRPHWRQAQEEITAFNTARGPRRRGVGIGCMWYGLGNTSMSNPSSMEVGLAADGALTLYNGAVDIGQGSATIMVQICAEALGLPTRAFRQVLGDTDRTLDAGKTSASRQTLVSGNAARLAGEDLRRQILRLANAGPEARLELTGRIVTVRDGEHTAAIDLGRLEKLPAGDVLRGRGYWDPPTEPFDEQGQGKPYASYGFAAQMALVEVDTQLGTTGVLKIWAAHDVGRAVNPTLVEGQIHGGIAQGLGLALMEEFVPGRHENLHDYLIPTVGDVPPIEVFLIDGGEELGPFGAKGVGEPALVATAPAIFGAIDHAVGVRPAKVPFTPDRLRAAILARRLP
jgi:CO/xanthine dehydrogenase Mo-binding subunit/aerobic-type carbon monoxide dehydrogenase small subunit (CoxS/CutS family)